MAAALAGGQPWMALAAYVALGAGLAVVVPLIFRAASLGADAGPALAGVTTTGYLGFLAGPPIIGGLAAAASVPAALLLVVAATAAVGLGAGALAPRREPRARAAPSGCAPQGGVMAARAAHRAILSDLDGVLVDSGDSIEETWRAWAAARDVDFARLDGRFHGVPSLAVIRRVAPHLDARAEAAAVEQMEIDNPAATVLPGAAALLGGATGLPLAIVTSCTDALARARLGEAGLPVPAVLVTADRVAQGKPHPEGYRAAAAALGIDPADCLVLEDAPAGIAAGRAAGAQVVGITTTHAREELAEAHRLAASVAEALGLAGQSPSSCA